MLFFTVPTSAKLSKCQAPRFKPAAVLLSATDHLALCTLWLTPHRWWPAEQKVCMPQNRCVQCTQYNVCYPWWELNPDLSVVQYPIIASLATGMHQMCSTNNGGPAHACLDGHLLFIRILMPLEHPIESNSFFRAPDRICRTLLRDLSQIIRCVLAYIIFYVMVDWIW